MSEASLADTNDSTRNPNSHTKSEAVSVGNGEVNSFGTERDSLVQEKEIQAHSTMPSAVSSTSPIPSSINVHSDTVFKIEPGTEPLALALTQSNETPHFNQDGSCVPIRHEQTGFIDEEPLEIQCGENSALLYISKLCQGSKGPCILFNNEWLTPNELQYISGRETAKDWKRSIRYKGKSLKSLIARGLIKVHPPICDCLGCRISSPVNRGRLASKCGVTPPSPRSRKRDVSKSLSCWTLEDLEGATPHRHYSTSDLDGFSRHAVVNGIGFKETRESSSSATSECSEEQDNPFSPVVKRPRSNSPEPELTFEERAKLSHKRRASDSSVAFIQKAGDTLHYDRAGLSMHRVIHVNEEKDPSSEEKQDKKDFPNSEEAIANSAKSRSAFRTVNQDGLTSMTLADTTSEGIQREMAIRAAKMKQKPHSPGGAPTQFLPPTYTTGPGMVSPTHTSPRLVPDPLLFANPHGSSIYHHAFRGAGYHGVPPLSRNLMQYRLLSPPGTGNAPQNPLSGLSLQNQLIMQDLAVMASVTGKGHAVEKKQNVPEENGIAHKRRRSSNDYSDNERTNNASVFSDDERGSPRRDTEQSNHDRTNYVSVIHKSPANSPLTVESTERKSSCNNKNNDILRKIKPHRLIPRLRLHLDENIVQWNVDQVAEFISSLTGSPEIVSEFKDQCIDGQSLILLKEEHLLNRLGIKLGPALKILAHIQKILERLSRDESPSDSCDSS